MEQLGCSINVKMPAIDSPAVLSFRTKCTQTKMMMAIQAKAMLLTTIVPMTTPTSAPMISPPAEQTFIQTNNLIVPLVLAW